ncbi:brain-specific serine protease 4-like isoform X1 [Alosa alosa]|uniref:brain-specific serine protease 4-like isoform X1 n=1 Tax=Alosa alosa TaxID=278164 RepID=UPI0020150FBF|nr:brain-specific serine protease 4-like isoform X1 [Alosa alosa]XP_048089667.1 brain-specific serine protease 4-like isoform X1 [Alosa alosa]
MWTWSVRLLMSGNSLKEPSGRLVRLKWVLHPEYRNNRGISNNIALVQLQEAVCFSDTVKPVVLSSPRDQFSEDTECWLTGWGHITLGWPLGGNQTLQEVQVSLFDDATCRQIYPWMTDRELCAGDRKGLKGACLARWRGGLCRSDWSAIGIVPVTWWENQMSTHASSTTHSSSGTPSRRQNAAICHLLKHVFCEQLVLLSYSLSWIMCHLHTPSGGHIHLGLQTSHGHKVASASVC